jgi:hypothetical protein
MDLSIAETETSTCYHLRAVGPEGLKPGGGLQRRYPALCGANVAWDTSIPLAAWNSASDIPESWCATCAAIAREMGLL